MSRQPYRTGTGGFVDRERPLSFSFDGRKFTGLTGDTLASALLANGIKLVGRSFKYHRRRGIFADGVEEPNALVRVRRGDRAEPNLKATSVELFHGLEAASQNHWPSLEFDTGAINNLASRFLPAGFYYKTFMWPASAWLFYERFIRKAVGLGKAAELPDPDRYEKRYAHCDVLVVGAGPSGLAAALAAVRGGARVIMVESDFRLGGSLLRDPCPIDDEFGSEWVKGVEAELNAASKTRVLNRATAFGYYDGNLIAVAQRITDHEGKPERFVPRQRIWWVRARRVVLATGATERPLVFAQNDLPGVMLASAVRTYAVRYGVRCGERAVVFTNNDDAYATVAAFVEAGGTVEAVVDPRAGGPSDAVKRRIQALGVRMLEGYVITRAEGRHAVSGVTVMKYTRESSVVTGAPERIDCDLVCVSGGWNPTVHLFSQSQGKLRFDEANACFVPEVSRQAERSVGAARGCFGLQEALSDGVEAGRAAAEACGLSPARFRAPEAKAEFSGAAPILPLWAVPLPQGQRGKRFVDLQNDVTAEDVALAVREGYRSVEHLKRYTTLGMGTDQGRTSNVNGLAILASIVGSDIPAVGTTTFRPPFSPVTLGALGGREVGHDFAPVRRTPMHVWHARAGAKFVTAGLWLRPQYYAHSGESMMQAIYREARAVRTGVGIVDVSTLGKIDIQGRDTAEFLERVYINRWKNLKVGRCRYGIMLREDGFVFDDGTTTRVGENHYYMTTTTANAGPVMAHLEYYAQTVWPELHVHLTSVSDQWAGAAVAGPRSRELLALACDGADLSNQALPFMGYLETSVADAPVRVFRMTFSGELAYEVHTPSNFAVHVWKRLLDAGRDFGVTPYGTEAMSILRIEKGHVVAAELDGRTVPSDFGFDAMQRKQGDFIGRRSLQRPALEKSARRRIVGLVSQDGRHIPRGAQLVWNPNADKPVQMLGHVTSTCYSPNIEKEIALALLDDPENRREDLLYASSPLTNMHVPVKVTHPVFIDPQGDRARG
ncbi:MAG: sarcosine oxidase subunit alpha family protein [Gammaproteobacteria bacterium]|nr:sarcosine oxidase subunit alpha family protein [Gammaproteobacteria bacterium]